jgi:hypothetical protein
MKTYKQLLCAAAVLTAGLATTQAQLIISEVHSTGSSSSTYARDWFELYNNTGSTINLSGWKVDDASPTFATGVALRGVASLAPGQIAVFMESDAAGVNDAANDLAFKNAWFGSSVPSGFTLGFYGGSGIGLSSAGDAVNIFNSGATIVSAVSFGAGTIGTSFDNASGLSGLISQLSVVGVNGAFNSVAGSEIGSPGFISAVPEPTSLSLAALGISAMIFRKRLVALR